MQSSQMEQPPPLRTPAATDSDRYRRRCTLWQMRTPRRAPTAHLSLEADLNLFGMPDNGRLRYPRGGEHCLEVTSAHTLMARPVDPPLYHAGHVVYPPPPSQDPQRLHPPALAQMDADPAPRPERFLAVRLPRGHIANSVLSTGFTSVWLAPADCEGIVNSAMATRGRYTSGSCDCAPIARPGRRLVCRGEAYVAPTGTA